MPNSRREVGKAHLGDRSAATVLMLKRSILTKSARRGYLSIVVSNDRVDDDRQDRAMQRIALCSLHS